MENRKKGRLLFFSISLLLLLAIIYIYEGGKVKDRGDKPTAATFVVECAHKTGEFLSRTWDNGRRRVETAYLNYQAKKTMEEYPVKMSENLSKTLRIQNLNVRFTLRNIIRGE